MAERYRITYRKDITEQIRFDYRDTLEEVAEWLREHGKGLCGIYIVREEKTWKWKERK